MPIVSTGRRITLTIAAGLLLGFATLVAEDQGFPSVGVNAAIDTATIVAAAVAFFVAPLVVGRWWVVLSMAGPVLAFLVMQVADVQVSLDDGRGAAINYRTIFQFTVLFGVMLAVYVVHSFLVARQSDQPG